MFASSNVNYGGDDVDNFVDFENRITLFSRCMSVQAPEGSSSLLQHVLAFISSQVDDGRQALREPLSSAAASALAILKVLLRVDVRLTSSYIDDASKHAFSCCRSNTLLFKRPRKRLQRTQANQNQTAAAVTKALMSGLGQWSCFCCRQDPMFF